MGSIVSEKPEAHSEVAMRMQGVTPGPQRANASIPLGCWALLERGRDSGREASTVHEFVPRSAVSCQQDVSINQGGAGRPSAFWAV